MDIIDIHTHILYGMDDGAKTLEDAVSILEKAYEAGTRVVFFTPHNMRAGFDTERANEHMAELVPYMKERFPQLSFYGGCEILCSPSAIEGVITGQLPTLASSRYILVEFMPAAFYSEMLSAIRRIVASGYIPIIAHTERYECLKPDKVKELVTSGALIQLNARSVIGKNGFFAKRYCAKLLAKDLVHFIASDCHDIKVRVPQLDRCAALIEKKYGKETATRIFNQNPRQIINNKPI